MSNDEKLEDKLSYEFYTIVKDDNTGAYRLSDIVSSSTNIFVDEDQSGLLLRQDTLRHIYQTYGPCIGMIRHRHPSYLLSETFSDRWDF